MSAVAAQWLTYINSSLPVYQELIHLYSVTSLTIQYQPMLHAINTSIVNIIQMLHEAGVLSDVILNGTDAAINLLSEIFKASESDVMTYNQWNVSTFNISDIFGKIRFQLDFVEWLLLQNANPTSGLDTTQGSFMMHTVALWITDNYQQIDEIIRNLISTVNSFNNSFSSADLLYLFNVTFQNENLQLYIQQAEMAMQNSSGFTLVGNLIINEDTQKDAELALQLLQELTLINTSRIITSINKVIVVLQGLMGVELEQLHQFHNNATVAKVFSIVKEGMSILYDIQVERSIDKEMVFRIYNFTYLLVHDELNWIPFQDISAMEVELLEVWYLAMRPFLGGNASQDYIGNCTAEDVLNILVQTIITNATGNDSIVGAHCLWQFVYNSSDTSIRNNQTLNEMIYLALQSSPIFHNICTENSLHPLAGEMACLLQLMELSINILSGLNNASGLHLPVIQSLNDSLTSICEDMIKHNTTFQPQTYLVHLLDQLFYNQSSPINFFIQFLVNNSEPNTQISDLQLDWSDISQSIQVLASLNGQFDTRIYVLVELILNVTHLPHFMETWDILDSFLSMNWTEAEVNISLSVLETLRKAIVIIDSGMDAKSIQIYQAVISLLKATDYFMSPLDLPCETTLSAVISFSDSLRGVFYLQNSSLSDELLSNISSLVCNFNVLGINSNLNAIKHLLPYMAYYLPNMTNYFTAAEKIVTFLLDTLNTNSFQGDMVISAYQLLMEELKLFPTTNSIASWLESIPLNNIYYLISEIFIQIQSMVNSQQSTTAEREVSIALSQTLSASSFLKGLSTISELLTLLPSTSASNINITQGIFNLIKEITFSVENIPLLSPNDTILTCVRNEAQMLSNSTTVIQLVQDIFSQIIAPTNLSLIPDLLQLKINQLQNLTSLICGLDGSPTCLLACQYSNLLKYTLNFLGTEIQNVNMIANTVTSLQYQYATSIFEKLWQSFENALTLAFSSVIPFQEIMSINLTEINSIFSSLSSTTPTSSPTSTPSFQFQVLKNVLDNSSHAVEQLIRVVNISQSFAEALMLVEIPENITEFISCFKALNQCSTNLDTVTEPLREFCNLSWEQDYQMTLIFLQNVDILKVFYNILVPTTWQTKLDELLSLLGNLMNVLNQFTNNFLNEQDIENLQKIKPILSSSSSRTTTSRSARDLSSTSRSTTPLFTDLTKYLCEHNYTKLGEMLKTFVPTLARSRLARPRAQNVSNPYGVPTGNAFCAEIFLKLVSSTSGAAYWIFLKPLLYGQIIYAPDTAETRIIMNKTESILQEMNGYREYIGNLSKKIQLLNKIPIDISNITHFIGVLQDLINNSFVSTILEDSLKISTTELKSKLNDSVGFLNFLNNNLNLLKEAGKKLDVLSNLLSCATYDRVEAIKTVDEMMLKAEKLQSSNELFAAITFHLPSETKRAKRDTSTALPKHVNYSISMRSQLSQDTSYIRDTYWTPGPHNTLNLYTRGFVYLQENIERAIIEMQTNKKFDDVAAQYQPMPYPCYNRDNFLYSMSFSLPIALMIAWVLFIAAFVKKLVQEKELRLHEYMKMMGINSCSHFFAWLLECIIFLTLTVTILVLILIFGRILPKSNGLILFLFFMDYSLTVIAMSYLISVFFHNTNVAALSGSLCYIITFFPFIALASRGNLISFAGKTLLSLFSPTALSYGTQYIVHYEEQDIGIQWHNLYNSPVIGDTFSCGWICWVMLIDSFIYLIIGAYIRTVFPGKYGIGAPWYFPFLPSFWLDSCGLSALFAKKPSGLRLTNMMAKVGSYKKGEDNDLSLNNEAEPTDLNVGVSLHGLTKTYKSKVAVSDLNLTFYEGHITALLGHNGAGKTTTLSMLTGLFSATSGTIYVYGEDIRTHLDRARKNMGVCMQYDVLFEHLTTKEHLLLYGSIKAQQWTKKQLHEEVKRTLKDTGLYNHRHKAVKALSGGMRRKLSISIALIGGSKVLILDEPTTGVDPCSRRAIWEVISKNKMDKTIILSTHHLDEAEILSDRIAFLEQGGLRCCGSPLFLKEKFGSGYHLTLTKKFPNQDDEKPCITQMVTELIQSHIPEAQLKEDVGGELVYVLPRFRAEISEAYLSLLRALDTSLNDLHLGCYGISDTTIEEVFLKLTDGIPDDEQGDSKGRFILPVASTDTYANDETSSTSYDFNRDDQALADSEKLSGFTLLLKKCIAIFIKRFHHSKRNWKGILSQILLPVLFVIAAMGLGSLSSSSASYPELLLSPNLYGTVDQSVPFGLINKSSANLMKAMDSSPGIDNYCVNNNNDCFNISSLGSWITQNLSIPYGTCNCSTGYTVCSVPDNEPPHRRTYSKQMMYNLTGYNLENYLLTTALQFPQKRYGAWSFGIPISDDSTLSALVPRSANMTLSTIWYNNEGPHSLPAFLNSFNNFLLRSNLPINESSQYGISVYNKPLSGSVSQKTSIITLVNTLVSLSILAGYSITLASFVTYIVKEHHTGAKRLQHIAGVSEVCYWLTHFLYDMITYLIPVSLSIAMVAAFKLPTFYNGSNLGAVSLLLILFGYATFAWMYLLAGAFKNPGMAFIIYVCINLFIGINTIIASSVVFLLVEQSSKSNSDYQNLQNTFNVLTNIFKVFPQFCFGYGLIQLSQQEAIRNQLSLYGSDKEINVFSMDIIGWMLSAMVIQGTFCIIVRLLINDGIIFSVKSFVKRTCLKNYQMIYKNFEEDEDVKTERERVESNRAEGSLLQLQDLTKVFHHVNKQMIAVNHMTLAIPPGECFGLLGVNGAGKTTTFKMLTGDISPSKGNIKVRDQHGNLVDVLGFNKDWSSFGYCPQEDALDDLMTGEEHLYYYARIHGIPERKIKSECYTLLQKLHLMQYKDRITANYSCGTRRKLSTALALIGKPSILLLDEPSSGMDPKTKRHLWKIISEEVKDRCAVVLTSHSMEECEALCTRLAIMVKGEFQCIGSLQHIKSRFGKGFTVKMHLKDSSVSVDTITTFMHFHFPNTYLKDHHFTMVEYHVPMSPGGVASIFDLLETNKTNLNIIHFSVSQTTLDEVFINFAQSQASPDNSSISSQDAIQVVST
uniref:ATP binding cassette subfamily A member 12 n=1 Tax=Leptobrachium leishanense TaxID=445787 RepID=A0A8C5MKI8_9ANUR